MSGCYPTNAVIVDYVRSPFTPAQRGALARVRPDDLAASVVRHLVQRTGIAPGDIEDLLLGCAFPEGEQGLNLARTVSLLAGLPVSVAATTINRYCGSSMQAVHSAVGAIQCGAGAVFVCAGVESMSRVPVMGFNPLPHPGLARDLPQAYHSMGRTAETVARRYGIDRLSQERLALNSHAKANHAQTTGAFADEIVPITAQGGVVISTDGCIRAETSLEQLASLAPAFDSAGTVTAGTASPVTDGAAAVLITSEAYAKAHHLPMLARIRAMAVAGCDPETMGLGPVPATRKALTRAGLALSDLGVIELNEAFAAQVLACLDDLSLDPDRINRHGGALALGHPLGATGVRLVGKTAALLHREGQAFGLATQCIGGGQGIATILEAVTGG